MDMAKICSLHCKLYLIHFNVTLFLQIIKMPFNMFHVPFLVFLVPRLISSCKGTMRQSVWIVRTNQSNFKLKNIPHLCNFYPGSRVDMTKLVGEIRNYSHRVEASLTVTFYPDSRCQIHVVIGC